MKRYGDLPVVVNGRIILNPTEMLFYQYLPIKMSGDYNFRIERRLSFVRPVINAALTDFIFLRNMTAMKRNYMYLTVKHLFQQPGQSFNRPGYHSDGFMTNDINYIWYDSQPTIFNSTEFKLSMDDKQSLREMTEQALVSKEKTYPVNTLLRLDQYNIHKVYDGVFDPGMRLFVKVSFSLDKYDLKGNSHNYEFDYSWPMKDRVVERNVPQSSVVTKVN